jgi:hypothetical protein
MIAGLSALGACATTKGALIGGGIGAIGGEAGKGAAIGASVGAVIDIID